MPLNSATEQGEVVELLPEERAKVKIAKHSSCDTCSHKSFCHPFGGEHMIIESDNRLGARSGQTVEVAFEPETQGKAILVLYGIPLLALLVGAFFGNWLDPLGNADASSAATGFLLVILSFIGIRMYTTRRTRNHPAYQPRIVSILPG
jgi:sigma-E factor negative regulatory protein RseC